eukprot:866042-Rhodomonas_salina.1
MNGCSGNTTAGADARNVCSSATNGNNTAINSSNTTKQGGVPQTLHHSWTRCLPWLPARPSGPLERQANRSGSSMTDVSTGVSTGVRGSSIAQASTATTHCGNCISLWQYIENVWQ